VKKLKNYIILALKGAGMGAANVIPGVSGGTVALITGIFEELIDSIKSFDLESIKLLFKGDFKEFAKHVNLGFLVSIFTGVAISIISLAKVLDYLLTNYPVFILAYFFGLILASVYFVGKTVQKWNISVIFTFILGTSIALILSLLNQATENDNFLYLVLCGVMAICSMILPGLSGAFALMLLGNYNLVVIDAVTNVRIDILLPVMIGAGLGLVAFSHIVSWIYKKFRDQTISALTGFVLGSLPILWPWKTFFDANGDIIPINKFGAYLEIDVVAPQDIIPFDSKQMIPDSVDSTVVIALVLLFVGVVSIWLMEKFAGGKQTS
jgi:putative membrane protein